MNKRQFLKASGALVAGTVLPRSVLGEQQSAARTNWAGNLTYHAKQLDLPKNVEEVREIVRRGGRLKALGARHAFNSMADTAGDQVSLKNLDEMAVDPGSRTVTVGGGVTYAQLGPYLDSQGFALHNLASLPHITVAGACATATHGSGNNNGNLTTAVSAMEIVTADGEVVAQSRQRDGDRFLGAAVHLGGIGIVTKLTLDVEPTFRMRQVVYENLSMAQLETHLDEIFSSGYSVSLFTDWRNHRITQAWVKTRVGHGDLTEPAPEFFGASRATRKLHPVQGHPADSCTEQLGVPGPWYERLPHFRPDFVPSSGAELQTEYFVPRQRGYEAIRAVEALRDEVSPHLLVTELRTVAADNLWMSPCYQRPSITIHFTWKPEWEAVRNILPKIEEKLSPFDPRPHWAKLFTMPPSRLRRSYDRFPEYRALLEHYDPQGKFRNEFLDANIYRS